MAYDGFDDYSSTELLDGYYPPEGTPVDPMPVAPEPQPAPQDFDPRREIDPMARQIFGNIENSRYLNREDKFRLQGELLKGISDVQAQRAKLDAERNRAMYDGLRLQQMQDSILANRRRQQAAVSQAETRAQFQGTVQGVLTSKLDPLAKREALNELAANNLGLLSTDPNASQIFNTAKSLTPIPEPREPLFTAIQKRDMVSEGLPPEVIYEAETLGDPVLAGKWLGYVRAEKDKQSQDAARRADAKKAKVTMLRDLAKDSFRFLSKEERQELGVSDSDPNPYLRPEDHERGRTLALIELGTKGFKDFDALPDAEKMNVLNELRFKALTDALDEATQEPPSQKDVTVDSLFK